ncbi:MAG: hypothetical protein H8E40_05910 [Chloroflexi bacterium]|nr:hypothetical protein [Chloroflexota bacterium]
MSTSRYSESDFKSVEHLLGYFDQQVLAAYRNEPHKYEIESDYFEGELTITNEYYRELESTGKTSEVVSIRFGYRTLRDGNLAIVAWLPDLFEKSKAHVQRWSAFHLKNPEWTTDYDERFGNWVLRYLEGSWDVDNGPLHYLGQTIKIINGLTTELVGIPLYKHEIDETLGYPAGENTHRYQDSHKELYGYLIDGLDKDCISRLASSLGKSINVGDKNTIQAIKKLFPDLETSPSFMPAVNLVSDQRRLASHGVRLPAENFPAFSQYTKDLFLCLEAVRELLAMLERDFGVNGEEVHKRHEAKKWLPHINRPPEAHYSIVQASRMKGKTVERVEFGFREEIEGLHESEALIIYFTDGSIMSLEADSNIGNLVSDENGLRPEDFHVNFMVHWVPELPKGMPKPPP